MERSRTIKDRIDATLDDSFPASDPPAWNSGHDLPPAAVPPAQPAPKARRKNAKAQRHPAGKA